MFTSLRNIAATSLVLLAAACVTEPPTELSDSQAEIGINLVSTTYYSCTTGLPVGEKTSGCVGGPPAQSGSVTTCYSVESEPCDFADYYNYIDFCIAGACDRFPYPIDPGPYSVWLANQ